MLISHFVEIEVLRLIHPYLPHAFLSPILLFRQGLHLVFKTKCVRNF